ncbi:hypothetical protein [Yimella sp. cx-51]|uniref:hypothetical protein n=1 Tax=Yimella sp. cx-51 TaxID=2770551 RepID=UPI00165E9C15|nr:hypothetical protein [Yimella sp. cx-51]MBC9956827.1 hypothetical protein [Yimella sp. cx-51]QTH39055.1 hypothetical protein J5M86_05370 [Yimella sp. cx-51]
MGELVSGELLVALCEVALDVGELVVLEVVDDEEFTVTEPPPPPQPAVTSIAATVIANPVRDM